jgi:hypothetical protein
MVLEKHLTDTFAGVTLDTFSVLGGALGFSDRPIGTYAIDTLEARHKMVGYDAIIVAGGSVIHFETLWQKVGATPKEYPIWKLWIEASRVAARYQVRLLWNNPEAPLDFQGWQVPVVRQLAEPVDFLSVRNQASKAALQACTDQPVTVGLDTAWLLGDLFSEANLTKSFPPELKDLEQIVVFHCNQRLPEESIAGVVELLAGLQKNNRSVVLLPLAYTNAEEKLMKRLQQLQPQLEYVDRVLSVSETMAVFSRCQLYIGLSFHGAITTACFGGDIIAFDYENRRKTQELYQSLGKADSYTTSLTELRQAVKQHLKQPSAAPTKARIRELQAKVAHHFEALDEALQSQHRHNRIMLDEACSIAAFESKQQFEYQRQLQELSDGFARCYAELQALRAEQAARS